MAKHFLFSRYIFIGGKNRKYCKYECGKSVKLSTKVLKGTPTGSTMQRQNDRCNYELYQLLFIYRLK